MGDRPWGPHGPEVPPHTVTPNPTAPNPVPQFGDSTDSTPPIPAAGGGLHLGDLLAKILVSLVILVLLWMPMICLYPLTAAAGIVAGFATATILARLLPADAASVAFVLAFAVGAIVVGIVNRIEYRLAGNPSFRLSRHFVRMALLAIWAIPIIMLSMGATAPGTSTRYILAVVSSPRTMIRVLMDPIRLGIWAAVVVGLHFLLWKAERVRGFWHRRLRFIGLK